MNIILIMSDTMRFDHLGCYGNDWIRTPHLDAFAEKCTVFDRAYQASFPTIPTRTDMVTGKYSEFDSEYESPPTPRDLAA